MKYLFDIGHPAHVHLFKNTIKYLLDDGHVVKICAHNKEVTFSLLDYNSFEYSSRPGSKKGLIKKTVFFFIIIYRLLRIINKEKPDLLIGGVGNAYVAVAGWMSRTPSIIFDDTEHSKVELIFVKRFASHILSPDCYMKDFGIKHLRYPSYHEFAYLHPNNFSSLKPNNYSKREYIIIRKVSWNASHDVGQKGISTNYLDKIIEKYQKNYQIMISAEENIDIKYDKYLLDIVPHEIHSLLKYASLYIGEGVTMASECVALGVPAIFVNTLELGYANEQEKAYKLLYNYRTDEGVIEKADDLLSRSKNENEIFHLSMLKDKIDLASFMNWFIDNYPESTQIMKDNPSYQYNFK